MNHIGFNGICSLNIQVSCFTCQVSIGHILHKRSLIILPNKRKPNKNNN